MAEIKKYNFWRSAEGFVFITGLLVVLGCCLFFCSTDFIKWKSLLGMILTGILFGKGASIPLGLGLFKDRAVTAFIVSMQDVVTILVMLPLIMLFKNNIIKNKFIEDFFTKGDNLTKDYKVLKTLGILGVGIIVWIPFHPFTGPLMGIILGAILGLSFWVNLAAVVSASIFSAYSWTFLCGFMFKCAGVKYAALSAIIVFSIVVIISLVMFLLVRRQKNGRKDNNLNSNIIDYSKVKEVLGLGNETDELWGKNWQISESSFTADSIFFLEPDFVISACKEINMAEDVRQAFIESLSIFKDNIYLQRLAWHCHFILFKTGKDYAEINAWPMIPKKERFSPDMFYAYVFLSGLDFVMDRAKKRKIPKNILIDTLSDLQLWIYEYKKKTGEWGLKEKNWLVFHFYGRIYKLGRLQFMLDSFQFPFHVFRNIKDHRVIALAFDKAHFKNDGQFNGSAGIFENNFWDSEYAEKEDRFIGNPISVSGKAFPVRVVLKKNEWLRVLEQKDPALGIHIPAVGPMDFMQCGRSFDNALEFFPKYFPEHKFRVFTCDSWLLDSQFEKYLEPDSNIVKFLKEFYLLPLPNAGDLQGSERIFGKKPDDLDEAPQETTLQRIYIKHIKNGGYWHNAGCLLFPEDLKWGSQVYRKNENMDDIRIDK